MMRHRLSIFSSDLRSYFTGAFGVSALLFIVFSAASFCLLRTDSWKMFAGRRIAAPVQILSRKISDPSGAPLVLFLGNSKMQSAVVSERLKKRLPAYDFLNLSDNSLEYWEMYKILQFTEKQQKLTNKKIALIVLEAAPFMFNANMRNPLTKRTADYSFQFDIWADKSDIALQEKGSVRAELYFKKFYHQFKLTDLKYHLHKIPTEPARPAYHTDLSLAEKLRQDKHFQPQNIVNDHCSDYRFSPYAVERYKAILDFCRVRGIKLLLLQLPTRKIYAKRCVELMGEKHRHYLELLKKNEHPLLYLDTPEDCGLKEDIFVDYGHFSAAGADLFSAYLGGKLPEFLR